MYVFFTLLVVFSTVTNLKTVRRLVLVWSGIAGLVAVFGLVQVTVRLYQLYLQHGDVYEDYVAHRFTGFMSHVMTFSGEDLVVLLMLVSFLFFARDIPRPILVGGAACALLLGGILLAAGARTVWLGVGAAGLWLLWKWRPWTAVAAPVTIVLFLWLVPGPVHDRFLSLVRPRKDLDSNEFRIICIRTGERMIEAHPWLGIGLDETKYRFLDYLPPDTRRPLPPGFYQHLHDIYLQYAAERGIPTLLVFLWLLGMILVDCHRALRRLPEGRSDQRFILHGSIASVVGLMVAGLFEANFADSEVLTMFLVVVACAYKAAEKVLPATIPSGSV
jgi:O-antigen ligase